MAIIVLSIALVATWHQAELNLSKWKTAEANVKAYANLANTAQGKN